MSLTAQQVFDNALNGVRAQNYQASMKGHICMYRGPDGLKCGIGHSIPDELYDPKMDNFGGNHSSIEIDVLQDEFNSMSQLFGGLDIHFLSDVQNAHDGMLSRDHFEHGMKEIATAYGLVYAPV